MLWTGSSLRLSLYFCLLSFSSALTSLSVPAAEKQLHSMSCYKHLHFGMYSAGWWAATVPFKHDAQVTRPDNIIFTVWGSFRCVFHVSRWREDWVWPHCDKAQIGWVCLFLLWYAFSDVRPFIKTCAFSNHTHSMNLPQITSLEVYWYLQAIWMLLS